MIENIIGKRFLYFDGAMGTLLLKKGLKNGELPEVLNIERIDTIKDIHKCYLRAGADILTTNTFGANYLKLKDTKYSVEKVVRNAVLNAKEAIREENFLGKYVALGIGPLGTLLEPLGTLKYEDAYNYFSEMVIAGEKNDVNLFIIETLSDLYEAKAAIRACKDNSTKPIICSFTFDSNGRTLLGADPLTVITTLESYGVTALGINCSLGPKELMNVFNEFVKYSSIPIIVQPNAGIPTIKDGETVFEIDENEYAEYMMYYAENGASILGGCCGTTDKHIKRMIEKVRKIEFKPKEKKNFTAITSGTRTVIIGNEKKMVGERINPTGKKKLKEALLREDYDYVLKEAMLQKDQGADILDVNMGMGNIDEAKAMKASIRNIQSLVNLPLVIDSSKSEVIEEALKVYNGKPLINSVNGKMETMRKIFPLAKKYGAAVLGLTLDENGIPETCGERYKIAEKIINTAEEYGIDKKDILIDTLTLTASSNQSEVFETIRALKYIKNTLNVKTVLGVSNVSFGLPNREIINGTFLSIALYNGLDLAIINPGNKTMLNTYKAYKVLSNEDIGSHDYIKCNKDEVENVNINKVSNNNGNSLIEYIIKGLKNESLEEVKKLLESTSPMDIINNHIIKALDFVGEEFENNRLFLPELIMSAEAVRESFELIKSKLPPEDKKSNKKILLATVKGDIHDIGKNIVKVIFENYGYEVIDMGKDADIQKIIDTVNENNIKIVGLSALMTTTVENMEKTIQKLRSECNAVTVIVGGAVLNKAYAETIGADFYAKDAIEGVKIAENIKG